MTPEFSISTSSKKLAATALSYGSLILLFCTVWAGEAESNSKWSSHNYTAEGQTATAELCEMWAPDCFWADYSGELDQDCPVLLGDYFPFLNYLSSPVIALTVFEQGSLVLEVLGNEGHTLDSFRFDKVECGAYIFKVEMKDWRDQKVSLRVKCEGGGEIELFEPRSVVLRLK